MLLHAVNVKHLFVLNGIELQVVISVQHMAMILQLQELFVIFVVLKFLAFGTNHLHATNCATQSNDWRLYLARKTTGFQGIRLLLAKDNNINKFYKIIIIKIHIYIKRIIIITFYGDLSSINSFSDLLGFLIVLFKHFSERI